MKFSIVIPTQNRPELLALAVHHVLNQEYGDIEVIVSDNSTSEDYKDRNRTNIEPYLHSSKIQLVSPPSELSPPEHFEFTLKYVKGDYVLYLTDKMILLPRTLSEASHAIVESKAEIVNWKYIMYTPDNYSDPGGAGIFNPVEMSFSSGYAEFDPIKELKAKASGVIPRTHQTIESYVTGKLCFGCYGRDLISRVIGSTGGLFGGCTHDYSAMVQGLAKAEKCAVLNSPGIVFISLPVDKSLGMLTHLQSGAALKYYQSFKNPDRLLNALLIPGLYSSSHNMVAHDYLKFLKHYNLQRYFLEKNWLRSIHKDLFLPNKVWESSSERKLQIKLFYESLNGKPLEKIYYFFQRIKILFSLKSFWQTFKSTVSNFLKFLGPLGKKVSLARIKYLKGREKKLVVKVKTLSELIQHTAGSGQ